MDCVIEQYGVLVFPPGERFEYSNLGYGLIDYLIERVSGRPFPEFMRVELFRPLGMTSSFVFPDSVEGVPVATAYDIQGEPLPRSVFDHAGATSVFASARDLVRFGMFHLKDHLPDQEAILSDRAIDEMHRPTTEGAADPYGIGANPYGLGWIISEVDGHRVVGHAGGGGGASARLDLLPEEDLAVAVIANQDGPAAQVIAREILVALGLAEPFGPPEADDTPFESPPEIRGKWTGEIVTHEGAVPLAVTVARADVSVRFGVELEDAPVVRLQRGGDGIGFYALHGLGLSEVAPNHAIWFDLRLEGDCLCGLAATRS